MSSARRRIMSWALALVMIISLMPIATFATEEPMSDEFKAILNDEGKFVMKTVKPTSMDEAYWFFNETDYMCETYQEFRFDSFSEDLSSCLIYYQYDWSTETAKESHEVDIVYQYEEDVKKMVDDIISKLPKSDEMGGYYFPVKDMELASWWFNSGDISTMIDYSGELKSYLNYKNFVIDCRMGDDGEFFTEASGMAPFMYDGIMYGLVEMGVRGNHVIYVPDDTAITVEALISAAKERLDIYAGDLDYEVTYGGQGIREFYEEQLTASVEEAKEELNICLAEIERLQTKITQCETDHAEYESKNINAIANANELAIELSQLEKLHNSGQIADEEYESQKTTLETQKTEYENKSIEYSNMMASISNEKDISTQMYSQQMAQKYSYESVYQGAVDEKEYMLSALDNEDGELYYLQSAAGDYWFNLKIGDMSYMFIIVTDSDEMVTPQYKSSDVATDVTVGTDDLSVPLDTRISVDRLTSGQVYEKIMETLKVKDNITFDITLYSNSIEKNITKLTDGKFEVKIPIGAEFEGKSLIVYYVDENAKIHEYEVIAKDGYALFNTDHFSIYTLAEKVIEDDTDDTESDKNDQGSAGTESDKNDQGNAGTEGDKNNQQNVKEDIAISSDGTVGIPKDVVDDAIKSAGTFKEVTLPLKDVAKEATKVKLPVQSLKIVADADKELVIETSKAVATLNVKVLDKIVKEAGTEPNIIFMIDEIKKESLMPKQQEAIKSRKIKAVISAEIICNNKNISNFGGEKIKIQIPFTPAEGTKGSDYKVLYVADDGKIEDIVTTYDKGYLIVELEHFSEYVIVKNEITSIVTGDISNIGLWISIISVSALVVGGLSVASRRKYLVER